MASFAFNVRGQKGAIPCIGFGTATLFKDDCIAAVRSAIKAGYRNLDTAYLYDNQVAVGEGIKQAIAAGDVKREDLFVTSKVAFYPADSDGTNCHVHLSHHPNNRKGLETTRAAIDECLALLQLDYVDLMLIHNPCTNALEYEASSAPHAFELSNNAHLYPEERELILKTRLAKAHSVWDYSKAEAARASSWKALEEALAAGKVRAIGVSNYPLALIKSMESYATVQPAVNQLEFHPVFSSPALLAHAASMGMVLTAYGSGNCVYHPGIAKSVSPVLAAIAAHHGLSLGGVVLKWTVQKGVSVVPRSANPQHQASNFKAASSTTPPLSPQEMAQLDALNKAHPFYWSPMPLLPPGALPDL